MAKKSRRDRRTFSAKPVANQQAPSLAPSAVVGEVRAAAPRVVSTPKPQVEAARKMPDFATEYRYVISDLRRMGILAGVLFVGLVVLALVV